MEIALEKVECGQCKSDWHPERCYSCEASLDDDDTCGKCGKAVPLGCPRCGSEDARERTYDTLFPDYVEQNGAIPDLLPELEPVVAAEGTLGHDQHGAPLRTEQTDFFVRHRIVDEDERELWELFFTVIASERSAALSDRIGQGAAED